MPSDRNYIVVSADGHCGASPLDYKPYLEQRYHDEFDRWAERFSDPWDRLDVEMDDFRVGVSSFASDLNWDSGKRMGYLERQGIAAEVLFPNTAPPFFPSGLIGAHPPASRAEYELRFAGVKAHNRWLAEFCDEAPGRRAGVGQIFLDDVEGALHEIAWCHQNGLRGILLPPDHLLQLSNLYYPRYEPVWVLCEELNLPLHRHGVVPSEAPSEVTGVAGPAIGFAEGDFFLYHPLRQLILAGVFDRHPRLKLVMSEAGAARVLPVVRAMDEFVKRALTEGTMANLFGGGAVRALERLPSEYLSTNIFHGSFFDAADIGQRHDVGIDHMMWGADFPHHEGTSPFSREALRLNFAGLPEQEVRQMTSLTAIEVYGFEQDVLQVVADRIGPAPTDVAAPLSSCEVPPNRLCPTFETAPGSMPE